jgi:hypothetical protein
MKNRTIIFAVALFAVIVLAVACSDKNPSKSKDGPVNTSTVTKTPTVFQSSTITVTDTDTPTITVTATVTVTVTVILPEIAAKVYKNQGISSSYFSCIIKNDQATPIANATVTINGLNTPYMATTPGYYFTTAADPAYGTNVTVTVKYDGKTYNDYMGVAGNASYNSSLIQLSWIYAGTYWLKVRNDSDNAIVYTNNSLSSSPFTIPYAVTPAHYLQFGYDSVVSSGAFSGSLDTSSMEFHLLQQINGF